jgi:hypothetical protein
METVENEVLYVEGWVSAKVLCAPERWQTLPVNKYETNQRLRACKNYKRKEG